MDFIFFRNFNMFSSQNYARIGPLKVQTSDAPIKSISGIPYIKTQTQSSVREILALRVCKHVKLYYNFFPRREETITIMH